MSYLTMLCLILITTLIAGQISRRLGQPAVIGQLLIGIVLGVTVFNVRINILFEQHRDNRLVDCRYICFHLYFPYPFRIYNC